LPPAFGNFAGGLLSEYLCSSPVRLNRALHAAAGIVLGVAVKAFIHRNRAADVIRALKGAGYTNLSVVDVKGMLAALDERERDYSIELGEETITEVKLELVCEDENRTAEAVRLIQDNAKTGQPEAGWIYISEIQAALPIADH